MDNFRFVCICSRLLASQCAVYVCLTWEEGIWIAVDAPFRRWYLSFFLPRSAQFGLYNYSRGIEHYPRTSENDFQLAWRCAESGMVCASTTDKTMDKTDKKWLAFSSRLASYAPSQPAKTRSPAPNNKSLFLDCCSNFHYYKRVRVFNQCFMSRSPPLIPEHIIKI